MEKFKASNGVTVEVEPNRASLVTVDRGFIRLAKAEMQGLREFFLAERDEVLGRWRWPENPDIVVVQSDRTLREGDRWVAVYDERRMGDTSWLCSDETDGGERGRNPLHDAGHDYFAAHPVSKPWHSAKPGEVWALTVDGVEKAFFLYGDLFRTGALHDIEQTDRHITAGRRLWPEVVSDV